MLEITLLVPIITDVEFTAKTLSQSDLSISSKVDLKDIPALFIKMSILPHFFKTVSTHSFQLFSSETSKFFVIIFSFEEIFSSSSLNFSLLVSIIQTLEPSSKNILEIASPIPEAPPVTIATLFSNLLPITTPEIK